MKQLTISYNTFDSWKELPESDQLLVQKAYEISDKAYNPYSKFFVGAALLMSDGSIVLGNNQENIAFPSGLCAERTALFHAGANFPDLSVQKMVIVGHGEFVNKNNILSPCGSCRQVMHESERRQENPIEVLLVSQNERTIQLHSVADLLPFAFVSGGDL